jgi:hypothetical protein
MADTKVKNIPPVKNPELEKIMAELKDGFTPERQKALSEALKQASLLSPCAFDVDQKNGKAVLREQKIRFFMLNTNDGKTFFPAFTGFDKTDKIKFGEEKPKFVVNKMLIFARMLSGKDQKAAGIILNPGTDNIVVPKNMVLAIEGMIKPAPKQKGRPVQNIQPVYGEPRVYPTKMVNALYELCEQKPAISRVWLKQKLVGPELSFFLVVEADGSEQKILDEVQACAVSYAKDVPVEAVFYSEQIEQTVIKGTVPLYDRNLGL